MRSFSDYLIEKDTSVRPRELTFDKNPKLGWYHDGDHIVGYHGTHERHIDSVYKNGLNRPDPKTGMISVALDPHTAHGYAAMSSAGGEAHFRTAGAKVTTTPHHERAVFKVRIPKDWAHEHMDHGLGGNIGDARKRLSSQSEYHSWKEKNPNSSDHEYYMGSELRFKKSIPPEFIEGHMKKVPSPPSMAKVAA